MAAPPPASKKKRKPGKSFIDLNPKLNPLNPANMHEAVVGQVRADYAIRLGLGDADQLYYYRQCVIDPKRAISNPQLRKYVADVAERALELIFNDPQMWSRAQVLLRRSKPTRMSRMSEAAYGSLQRRADKNGLPVAQLLEVWGRGIDESEDAAFARVASFLDGGTRDDDVRGKEVLAKIRNALGGSK